MRSPWPTGKRRPATRCGAPWSPSAISTACIAATRRSSRPRAARAAALGRPAAALTFEPHPRSFFRPQEPLFRLTDARNKLRLLASTGLDGAIVLRFDAALAALSADEFVERILIEQLAVSGVTIGFDFHFGANRTGSPDYLAAAGARHGFAVDIVPRFEDNGRRISSGPIRAALAEGHVADAAEMLGFPWFVSGEVVHGDKRGRELGYPTANLRLDPTCGLRHGIYAVRVDVGGRRHRRRREFRPPADVRRRHRAARSVPVRFFRRPLRADDRRRVHRVDQAGAEIRQRSTSWCGAWTRTAASRAPRWRRRRTRFRRWSSL